MLKRARVESTKDRSSERALVRCRAKVVVPVVFHVVRGWLSAPLARKQRKEPHELRSHDIQVRPT
jgi:hypothetical protein